MEAVELTSLCALGFEEASFSSFVSNLFHLIVESEQLPIHHSSFTQVSLQLHLNFG